MQLPRRHESSAVPVPALVAAHSRQLSPSAGSLVPAPLGQPPFLHPLRGRRRTAVVVRGFLRYYEAVRPPTSVHPRSCSFRIHRADLGCTLRGQMWDLPAPARSVSLRAWGLGPRGVAQSLAMTRLAVLPSACPYCVGTPDCFHHVISRLNGQPAGTPVNASPAPSRTHTHDSGPV